MKKRLSKIFCFLLVGLFAICMVGCGSDKSGRNQLEDLYNNGQMSEEEYLEARRNGMTVPLYGTKALYHPDNYDWDGNVGNGNANYYGQYAYQLLDGLVRLYGTGQNSISNNALILSQNDATQPDLLQAEIDANRNSLEGFYDSIRFQVSEYSTITVKKVNKDDESANAERTYFQVTANLENGWKWNLGPTTKYSHKIYTLDELLGIPTPGDKDVEANSSAYLNTNIAPENTFFSLTFGDEMYPNSEDYPIIVKDKTIQNYVADYSTTYVGDIREYYSENIQSYETAYMGFDYFDFRSLDTSRINESVSDYVKALEYAIYCINLNLNPNQITVNLVSEGDELNKPVVTVMGYENFKDKEYDSSVDYALATVKNMFTKQGTYVGMNEKQELKLINWIMENVIGSASSDSFTIQQNSKTITQYVKLDGDTEVLCDKDGTTVTDFTFEESDITTGSPITVQRHYRDAVTSIVNICKPLVKIGQDDSSSEEYTQPEVNDRYLASHIIDYWGEDMFLSPTPGAEFDGIEAREYQSIACMFCPTYDEDGNVVPFSFSNLSMHFKYDADNDGDEYYDPSKSLLINVHLNLYTHDGGWRQIGMLSTDPSGEQSVQYDFPIMVQDGPFQQYQNTSTLTMFGIGENGMAVQVGAFDPTIGGGVLMSIQDGYSGHQSPGIELPLSGNNNRRNFYQIIEPENMETGESYYSYGILNPLAFAGTNVDYFEIAFEVIRDPNDTTSNRKFQVAFGSFS